MPINGQPPGANGGDPEGYEPIQTLHVENYGCIRKATFTLSPLHALIGPNDSGKSTTLRALRTVAQGAASQFVWARETETWQPFDPMLDPASSVTIRFRDGVGYRLSSADPDDQDRSRAGRMLETVLVGSEEYPSHGAPRRGFNEPGLLATSIDEKEPDAFREASMALRGRITTATMIRFDSNALRAPSRQILANEPIQFFDETGHGLPSVYQALNTRHVDVFVAIRNRLRDFFPTIRDLLLPTVASNDVVIKARLAGGNEVDAGALSDGVLYFMGFAGLRYLRPSRLFLVEEPENGLHPARIAEVMNILREISKQSQVIIATHSPLVVNELEGHEVSVVTRDPEDGTRSILLKDVPGFDDAAKVYKPGEFWVSYADGKLEEPLLSGMPRP